MIFYKRCSRLILFVVQQSKKFGRFLFCFLGRISLAEIFSEHDWFKVNLPDYLFPKSCEEGTNIIDLDAIQEVCEVKLVFFLVLFHQNWIVFQKFGVSETEVQDALLVNDRHDQLVIAYHLIIDNKRIWNEGLEEKDFFGRRICLFSS